jgi:hypothetical protein
MADRRVKQLAEAHEASMRAINRLEAIDLRRTKDPLRQTVKDARDAARALEEAIRMAITEDAIVAAERARQIR